MVYGTKVVARWIPFGSQGSHFAEAITCKPSRRKPASEVSWANAVAMKVGTIW
jgi:hypothetical protein